MLVEIFRMNECFPYEDFSLLTKIRIVFSFEWIVRLTSPSQSDGTFYERTLVYYWIICHFSMSHQSNASSLIWWRTPQVESSRVISLLNPKPINNTIGLFWVSTESHCCDGSPQTNVSWTQSVNLIHICAQHIRECCLRLCEFHDRYRSLLELIRWNGQNMFMLATHTDPLKWTGNVPSIHKWTR